MIASSAMFHECIYLVQSQLVEINFITSTPISLKSFFYSPFSFNKLTSHKRANFFLKKHYFKVFFAENDQLSRAVCEKFSLMWQAEQFKSP